MIEKIIEILKTWKDNLAKDIKVEKVYLFGSSIYREGILFDPAISDLDLIIIMPENLSPVQRLNWLIRLKEQKKELEKQMLFLLSKKATDREIISIVTIERRDLNFDIHKSRSRTFFRTNDFFDLDADKIVSGSEIVSFVELKNELAIQVLESIQKTRNLFLKNSAIRDLTELKWTGYDVLPKDFSRECAKVQSMANGIKVPGDQFNLSFGNDFIKDRLRSMMDVDTQYAGLYNWIDSRAGGRSHIRDKEILSAEMHVLLYEVLYDLTIKEIESSLAKQSDNDKLNEDFLNTLTITDEFEAFLEDSELLTKAHSRKEKVLLSEIFIYPELAKYDSYRAFEKTENSEDIIRDFKNYSKLLIAGSDQSGKTTLCKKIFVELLGQKLVPLYINDKSNNFLGNIELKLEKAFQSQYNTGVNFNEIKKEYIVPVIDDFHFAKHKEKFVNELARYDKQIIIVDDIFGLNLKNEKLIKSYFHFKIQELRPSLRNSLIKNWISLNDTKLGDKPNDNNNYQQLDKATEFINASLGKIIGSGIMPAHPFFILSLISNYETFDRPLDQEITSQGHCYQALLYMYLKKQGVKNDEIDTYINFLTELAYFFYKEKVAQLSQEKFNEFLNDTYLKSYNLPVKLDVLLKNLARTNIFSIDDLNNYYFCYSYIYYFFVGKYLAEQIEKHKEEVVKIINNLHKNENAYIAVFISHHSKNSFLLDEIVKTASSLFEKFKPATLSETELGFFDEKVDMIIKAVLPAADASPENARDINLKNADQIERQSQESTQFEKSKDEDEEENEIAREMRRSIKTVEVMGTLIKNRSGSLLKPNLESIFEEGMKVHLRIINSFVELIRDPNNQNDIEEMLLERLNIVIKEKGHNLSHDQLVTIAKRFFWNSNFVVIYALVDKIIHSLGSDKLTLIVESVCDKEDSPASFIVKHGILMWYNKNLQIDKIADKIDSNGFSKTARALLNHKIANHCKLHAVGFRDIQKIGHRLHISPRNLRGKS